MQSTDSDPTFSKIDLYLELAVVLYNACASIQRISDSVKWLARHFGDEDLNLYVGNEFIQLYITRADNFQSRIYTLPGPSKVNVAVLHYISRILHKLSLYQSDISSISAEIGRIKHKNPEYPVPVIIFLTSLACAAFGWINHGDIQALVVIWISSLIGLTCKYRLVKVIDNIYLLTFAASFIGGICAALIIPVSGTQTASITLICSVLFLIPGVLLINGGMDLLRNYQDCGIARIISVFIQVFVIAGGLLIPLFMIQSSIHPGNEVIESEWVILTIILASGVAAFGFAILFNTPVSALAGCFICGVSARFIRELAVYVGLDIFLSILSGMTFATLLAIFIGRYTKIPAVILAVTAGIPMLPGLALIQGLQGIFVIAHLGNTPSEAVFLFTIQHVFYAGVVIIILIISIIFTIILVNGKTPRV